MKKRCLSLLLALVMVLGLLPAAVFAADSDFTIEDGVLTKYNGTDTELVIPDGVTSIGESAFMFNNWPRSVTIPGSVTSIGRGAFVSCVGLTSVTIQDGVTTIGDYAFSSCFKLTSVTIPDSVTSIGPRAFDRCLRLTNITIPGSVTTIGDSAFLSCEHLTSVTIPKGVTSIGEETFLGCLSLTSVTIPDSVTTIGDMAFAVCTSLRSVTIPDGVTSIGRQAFETCKSLNSITIPGSVTRIGDSAFADSLMLKDVYFGGTQAQWKAISSSIELNKNAVVHCSDGNIGGTAAPELPKSVVVDFDTQGGSGVPSKTVTPGEPYGALPTPTRAGCIFDGWYTARTGGSKVTSSTIVTAASNHTTLYAHWIETDGKLTVFPGSVTFDKAQKGYAQPAAKTVTVKNTGDGEITLSQPTAGSFELGRLSRTTLAPNASATFTVRPKAGLKAGTYTETITVKTGDGKTSAAVSVSFTVEGKTSSIPFTDVPNWAKDAVEWAVANNVTNGTGKDQFSPNDTCTMAHILTFLYRAKGWPAVSIANPFTNVKQSDYYYGPVVWAVEQDLISGNTFDPNAPCTRAAVVTYLWKLAGRPAAAYDNRFTDVAANAEYAQAVAWAVANGVTNGMSNTTFAPANTCTRGQIVTFLYRAYK